MQDTPGARKIFLIIGLCVFSGALFHAWIHVVQVLCRFNGIDARLEQTIDAKRFDAPDEQRTTTSLVKAEVSVGGERHGVSMVHYSPRRILAGSTVRAWPPKSPRYAAQPLAGFEFPLVLSILSACFLAAGIGAAMAIHGLRSILFPRH